MGADSILAMRRLFLLLLIVHCCTFALAAAPVKRIYVFGDSYSDVGDGFVYSNGPTAIAYLAKRLGLEMVPGKSTGAAGKSLNFAVSAARTGDSPPPTPGSQWKVIGMKDQVTEFAEKVRSGSIVFDPKTTLFFLAGGLNDGREQTESSVAHLESEMQTLYALGGRRFLVAILPEKIPAFSAVGTRLNPALEQIPGEMKPVLKGAEIALSGWGRFFDEVMQHPSPYGITNTTAPCVGRDMITQQETMCTSPDAYFYFYPNHPSKAVAKAVGDMMYDEIMSASAANAIR
jgi:phospholipase/lecithinase/hemolysin